MPAETRRYRNDRGETVVADVQLRPNISGEGHLIVELSIEAFEMFLDRAGFHRTDEER